MFGVQKLGFSVSCLLSRFIKCGCSRGNVTAAGWEDSSQSWEHPTEISGTSSASMAADVES